MLSAVKSEGDSLINRYSHGLGCRLDVIPAMNSDGLASLIVARAMSQRSRVRSGCRRCSIGLSLGFVDIGDLCERRQALRNSSATTKGSHHVFLICDLNGFWYDSCNLLNT